MNVNKTYIQRLNWVHLRSEVLTSKSSLPIWMIAKILILTAYLIIGGRSTSVGQSLSRSVFVSGGGLGTNSSGQLSSTVGQLWTHTTHLSGNLLLTQGFQQPNPADSLSTDALDDHFIVHFGLYPNPVKNSVTLEMSTERNARLEIEVLDLRGRRMPIPIKVVQLRQGVSSKTSLDLSVLPSAVYVLMLREVDTGQQSSIKFVKQN